MFENLNAKLKVLACVQLVGGVILSIVVGVRLCNYNLLLGLITIGAGALASVISAWPVYAIGEILDIAEKNRAELKSVQKNLRYIMANDSSEETDGEIKREIKGQRSRELPYACGKCGKIGPYEDNCPSCGSSIKVFNINNN